MFLFLISLEINSGNHYWATFHKEEPNPLIISKATEKYSITTNGNNYDCYVLNTSVDDMFFSLDSVVEMLTNDLNDKCSRFKVGNTYVYKLCHFASVHLIKKHAVFDRNGKLNIDASQLLAQYQEEYLSLKGDSLYLELENNETIVGITYKCDETIHGNGKIHSVTKNIIQKESPDGTPTTYTKYDILYYTSLLCLYKPFLPSNHNQIKCYIKEIPTKTNPKYRFKK